VGDAPPGQPRTGGVDMIDDYDPNTGKLKRSRWVERGNEGA
jgi:hypothetical protein